MEYLEHHDSISTTDYVRNFPEKLPERTACKDLRDLEKLGMIHRKGHTKGVIYTK
jgi:DeoR/GlpR family transcriptional regulator of sugar metabolism